MAEDFLKEIMQSLFKLKNKKLMWGIKKKEKKIIQFRKLKEFKVDSFLNV